MARRNYLHRAIHLYAFLRQYTKHTLSTQIVLPGEPTYAPPRLEVNCTIRWVGFSPGAAQPFS